MSWTAFEVAASRFVIYLTQVSHPLTACCPNDAPEDLVEVREGSSFLTLGQWYRRISSNNGANFQIRSRLSYNGLCNAYLALRCACWNTIDMLFYWQAGWDLTQRQKRWPIAAHGSHNRSAPMPSLIWATAYQGVRNLRILFKNPNFSGIIHLSVQLNFWR